MAKRKLSRRQQWRIQKIQEERLARAQNKQTKLSEEFKDQIKSVGIPLDKE